MSTVEQCNPVAYTKGLLSHWGNTEFCLDGSGRCYSRQCCYCCRKQNNCWNCKTGLLFTLVEQRWLLLGFTRFLRHPSGSIIPPAVLAKVTWCQKCWHRQQGQTSWCIHTSSIHWALFLSGKHAQGCTERQPFVRCSFRSTCLSENVSENSETHWVTV